MALLQEIGNRQVLIWIQFKYEAQLILEALSPKARVCNSTISTLRQIENIQDFKAGKYQYLIAHPASIGHGNTLVNCSDAIYYSLSHSFEKHSQSADRNYRKGQKNQCSYFLLDFFRIFFCFNQITNHKNKQSVFQEFKHKTKKCRFLPPFVC